MKALVIEDNRSDQMVNKLLLESLGYEATLTDDCDTAVPFLVSDKFDLILLDLSLPIMSGIQFLLGYRSSLNNSDTPVIVVSGKKDDLSRSSSKKCGATQFLNKPIDMNQLRKAIDLTKQFVKGGHYE